MTHAEQEIKQMLFRLTGLEPEEINNEDMLVEGLGIDSLKIIEIATQLERTYKIVLKDSQLMNLKTVKDIVDLLEPLLVQGSV